MADLEEVLDQIISGVMYPVDASLKIFDFFTIWLRDWAMPTKVKEWFPFLACRGYDKIKGAEGNPSCKPAKRYYHKNMFSCKYYNPETKECDKYKKSD